MITEMGHGRWERGRARLGMCSVGRGNVFSFLPNVFTFRPNVFKEEGERGERREVRVGEGGWGTGTKGRRDSPFD